MPQDLQRLFISPEQFHGEAVQFSPEQTHYLYRVLRRQKGERVVLLNGQGQAWVATLEDNQGRLEEAIALDTELPISLTLIVALPKGNGFEEILRQGTELGVTTFQPVTSDRTIAKPNPKKLPRWQKIVTEAAEQSERAVIPSVREVVKFTDVIQQEVTASCYLCVARGDAPSLFTQLNCDLIPPAALQKSGKQITIATGPEGGWTPGEIEGAIAAGFQPVSLGKRVLRAVTAPIVAASIIANITQ